MILGIVYRIPFGFDSVENFICAGWDKERDEIVKANDYCCRVSKFLKIVSFDFSGFFQVNEKNEN